MEATVQLFEATVPLLKATVLSMEATVLVDAQLTSETTRALCMFFVMLQQSNMKEEDRINKAVIQEIICGYESVFTL